MRNKEVRRTRTFIRLGLSGVFLFSTLCGQAQIAGAEQPLTLERALAMAAQANPEIGKASAALSAAQGELQDARPPLFHNPEITVENRHRRLFQAGQSDAIRRDWGGGLSQVFEIAGQQGLRREAGTSALQATEQDLAEVRRRVSAEVESRFVTVLALQRRIAAERRTVELIERNTSLASRRVKAGEDSKLDGNLALIDVERARNQLDALSEQQVRARADLAAALQLPPSELPEVQGELSARLVDYNLNTLLAGVGSRPALHASQFRVAAARSRLGLEQAARYPDVTLGVNVSRELAIEGRDRITTISVTVPLPLFRRNSIGIGRATTELAQAQVDQEAIARNARAQTVAAWQRLRSLLQRSQRLQDIVKPKLEENLALSERAYRAGEISLPQLLLVQRQALEAQRDLIDAQLDLRLTQIELEYNAGWLQSTAPGR